MMVSHMVVDGLGEWLGLVNDLAVFRDRIDAVPLSPEIRSDPDILVTTQRVSGLPITCAQPLVARRPII
jgi:hypothetical protein